MTGGRLLPGPAWAWVVFPPLALAAIMVFVAWVRPAVAPEREPSVTQVECLCERCPANYAAGAAEAANAAEVAELRDQLERARDTIMYLEISMQACAALAETTRHSCEAWGYPHPGGYLGP